ncbi:MAG: beta-ketoacyl-ACP synthase II [Chloroflexi bacterium]|nr:beta-ketoacyl-ACP synthase II [Chloroflexota bacterium]MCL5074270.1 beta-ketoacyl-ACP synthase II [Chloroflexota bacterium]
MYERVVVTGMGAITPLGLDVDSTWQSLIAGHSGVDYITYFDPSAFETKIAAEVKGFDPGQYIPYKEARRMDRFTQLAIAATSQALEQSKLKINASNAADVGVIVGSGVGGMATLSSQYKVLLEQGPSRLSPFLSTMFINDIAAGQIAITFGMQGPNFCTVSACASGAHAIGEAYETIRRGDAQAMVAGGTDAAIVPIAIGAFNTMRAISTRNAEPQRASRPFDAQRDGFVLGEGAAVLILENSAHAEQRGAEILGEISGYAATADASHVTAPVAGGAGAALAMQRALQKANIAPEEVDYINAHGTATPLNDKAETEAIKTVFGAYAYKLPISSTKSMTGHLLGGAGSLEALISLLVIRNGIIPPTINLDYPDPDCDLDYVPHVARRAKVGVALSNSLGFGGHNATLILKAWG